VTEITIVVPARRAKDEPLLVHMVDFGFSAARDES
jgi:hypothetical protein